jgi:hypothetical protein
MNKTNPKVMKKATDAYSSRGQIEGIRKSKPKDQPIKKIFEHRHLFIIADGQDILSEDLKFTYVEVNERLSKFVPDKVWKSNASQRLTLN